MPKTNSVKEKEQGRAYASERVKPIYIHPATPSEEKTHTHTPAEVLINFDNAGPIFTAVAVVWRCGDFVLGTTERVRKGEKFTRV